MRRSVPLLITMLITMLITATPLLAASPADAAQAGRCDGKRPTIVSDADEVLGTPRADVIVVNGRGFATVLAGEGDDTICLRSPGRVQLDAGGGDDRVLSQDRSGEPRTQLGPGDDAYVGSEGTDSVEDAGPGRRERAGGVNTIRTAGGDDEVTVGHRRGANRDTVDLGSGDDSLALVRSKDLRRASFTGGDGADTLTLFVPGRGALAVDAQQGAASIEGVPLVRWSSFEEHLLGSRGTLSFTGTSGDDTVTLVGRGRVTATTGAGDDTIAVAPYLGTSTGSVDGGDGSDVLQYTGYGDVVGDVATGTVTTQGVTLTATSLERWEASTSGSVELTGSTGDDVLQADGCTVTLRGGAGDDQLTTGVQGSETFGFGVPSRCRAPRSTALGEAGDDVLVGAASQQLFAWRRSRERATLLDGGEGNDVAVGGPDGTTCLAETRVSCED